jgi:tRNA dimethylallyltransferase
MNLLQELNINPDQANVLFIGGPTASGKTGLAIKIAQAFQDKGQPTSIISADSRQIYLGMTVCTAKPVERKTQLNTNAYLEPVPFQGVDHYLFDVVKPDQRYTLFDFQSQSKTLIQNLHKQNHKVIVAGGTGLYIDSLINNYTLNSHTTENKAYKEKLTHEYRQQKSKLGLQKANQDLWEKLHQLAPEEASKINQNNWQSLIRALEVLASANQTKSSLSSKSEPDFQYQMLVLTPPRQDLYDYINQRCLEMFEKNLIQETKSLTQVYSKSLPAMTSIGYKQVQSLLTKEISKEEAIQSFQQATRKYAKRQLTWFRRYKDNPHTKFIDSYKLLKKA